MIDMVVDKIQTKISNANSARRSFRNKKRRVIEGLIKTSFSSHSIYDFLEHKVVYSQWHLLKSLGYSPEEYEDVSARFFRKIIHPDDVRVVENHFKKILSSEHGKVLRLVIRLKNKQDKYRWIAIRDTALYRKRNGQVTHLIGSALDVTNYKTLKDRISKKREALDKLSYRASHDLRGPVATAKGLLSLMKYNIKNQESAPEILDSLEKTIDKIDDAIKEFGRSLDPRKITESTDSELSEVRVKC